MADEGSKQDHKWLRGAKGLTVGLVAGAAAGAVVGLTIATGGTFLGAAAASAITGSASASSAGAVLCAGAQAALVAAPVGAVAGSVAGGLSGGVHGTVAAVKCAPGTSSAKAALSAGARGGAAASTAVVLPLMIGGLAGKGPMARGGGHGGCWRSEDRASDSDTRLGTDAHHGRGSALTCPVRASDWHADGGGYGASLGGAAKWLGYAVGGVAAGTAALGAGAGAVMWRLVRSGAKPDGETEPWQQQPDWVSAFRSKDSLTFALVVWGTRGDVQPVLILAQELRRRGHKVRLAIPPEFLSIAASYGLEAETRALETGMSMANAASMFNGEGGGPLAFFKRFFANATTPLADAWLEMTEDADVMIGQLAPMATEVPLAVARKRKLPLVFTAHDPMVFPCAKHNKLPGESGVGQMQVVSHMFGFFGRKALAGVYERLGLPAPRIHRAVPLPLLWSMPLLITFPKELFDASATGAPAWWHQTGAWRAPKEASDEATVDPDLQAFVEGAAGQPVFVGFGSLSRVMVKEPQRAAFTAAMYQGLLAAGETRLVLQGGSADPSVPVPEGLAVFEAEYLPHAWLFPRCKAAFVHGGAGTMAASVASGIPVVVVPATPLQAPWGGLVTAAGGTSMKPAQLTDAAAWTAAVQHTQQAVAKEAAGRVGAEVAAGRETGVQRAVDALLGDLEQLGRRNAAAAAAKLDREGEGAAPASDR